MKTKSFVTALIVSIAVGLSGCASAPSSGSGSASSDTTRTKQEGALFGAVLGGLLGAALGRDNRTQGALIGATVGAGVGYVAANEVAKRKERYASEEDMLNGEIASAQRLNATAGQYNASLQKDIHRLEQETRALTFQYSTGRVASSRLEAERSTVKSKIDSTKTVLDDLTKEHEIKTAIYEEQMQKRGVNNAQVGQLRQEIAQLKQNIDELNQHSRQLASIDERLAR
ncbi:MAG: glycine zipper 2TM domain-containing protein [Chromatiales bacterium]|nr:glycine zipper 2TM domain-containing protein [Chromatiales bacterium]